MPDTDNIAWGGFDRYYATNSPGSPTAEDEPADGTVAFRLKQALNCAMPDMRKRIEQTVKHWNSSVRDALRNETGLKLAHGTESRSIPVFVADGLPKPFEDVMVRFRSYEWLLVNRPDLDAAIAGTKFMLRHFDDAHALWGSAGAGTATRDEIERVRATAELWAERLEQIEALRQIAEINQDVLGAYFFKAPRVFLYWMVIGTVARILGVDPEALAVVVLAHELAHAYTHQGFDIDGEDWNTSDFEHTDVHVVEGLAQFYTAAVCGRLSERYPQAQYAYASLLQHQSSPYTEHTRWIRKGESAGEIIRISMIQCRSAGIQSRHEFAEAVAFSREQVGFRTQNNRAVPQDRERWPPRRW